MDICAYEGSTLLNFSPYRRETLLLMNFLPLSQSCSRGLAPHAEKEWSQNKGILHSLGSAEVNLYLQAAASS